MMKRTTLALIALLAISIVSGSGCRSAAQQPPAPYYQCPAPGLGPNNTAGNYATLNLATPASALTYSDVNSSSNVIVPGTWCYIAQTLYQGGTSAASNVTMVTVQSTNHQVNLSWTAPGPQGNFPGCSGGGCTYIVSRIAAVATTVPAPPLGGATTAVNNAPPGPGQINTLIAEGR